MSEIKLISDQSLIFSFGMSEKVREDCWVSVCACFEGVCPVIKHEHAAMKMR